MADPFVGEVRCVGFNFAPKGWAECNGQLIAISQNTALFSLLGTYYGGDGKSTFGLPNLQGNVAIGYGNGAGLSPRGLGEQGGEQTLTLLSSQMPQHNHSYMVDLGDAPASNATPNATAALSAGPAIFSTAKTPLTTMASSSLVSTGNNLPHNNMMPYLTLNFVIAMQGVFPARQ